jgi:hypothetical protein
MDYYVCYCFVLVFYLKSVLRYRVLILSGCHPDTVYLREQGCENPWLFLKPKWVREQKEKLGNTALTVLLLSIVIYSLAPV